MNCNLVRDLMPLYIEKDCSPTTKKLIENHLESCIECSGLHSLMNDPILIEQIEEEDSVNETSNVMQYYYGKLILKGSMLFAIVYVIIILFSFLID